MINKTPLFSTLDKLPKNLTVDHLIFIEKVQKGLVDSEMILQKLKMNQNNYCLNG